MRRMIGYLGFGISNCSTSLAKIIGFWRTWTPKSPSQKSFEHLSSHARLEAGSALERLLGWFRVLLVGGQGLGLREG